MVTSCNLTFIFLSTDVYLLPGTYGTNRWNKDFFFFFQVSSNLFDYFIFKLYFHTVVFKDSLCQRKGCSSLFSAEQVKRFVVKILFILVSWFKGLQREKLSVTAEVTKYH